jgi:hypothetical protein
MRVRFCDEFAAGFGWIAAEPVAMERASHALVVDGRVWLVDAVDGEAVLDRVRTAGEPAGVLQLVGRHRRDCATLARALGVPHYVVPRARPGTAPFELVALGRREIAIWWPQEATLVVGEALGTAPYYRAPGERLGLHPFRRLTPPRSLERLSPRRLLFGHGDGIHDDAAAALAETLAHGRRRAPAWLAGLFTRRNA